uniref:Reverse transcriptase domain-containing protein n=1 Tax=Gasterosteus aculeatus aculeatus TaxID=481459 RepID=A0AAQ4Q691_GASAC
MKSFERLVLSHLKSLTDPLLDPLQFAYRANRSVDDAVNMALHYILQHLDSPGTYARIMFVDFSSAFNTIIPSLLQDKLSQLHVPDSTCRWITDFLSDRKQHVKLGKHVSASRTISTGSPQGCVLSPLLFSLYTNSCTSSHQSVKLLKFADDTTLIGLISGGDESAYRWESDHLVSWCSQNNLELNALKTVEMVVDFRRNRAPPSPITLCDSPVTIVDSFRFLGSIITQDLKWELNISSITKKAQQRLFFLRQLKKLNLPKTMMVHFYTAIIESILCSSITVWYAAATAKDKGRLQRVIRSAERVIGCNLPSLQDLFASRSLKRAKKIAADPSHPGQKLFVPLPSGRRLRSIRTTTSRHTNSFFPSAVGLINRARSPLTDYNIPPVTPPHTAHDTLTAIHHFVTCHFVSCLLLVC